MADDIDRATIKSELQSIREHLGRIDKHLVKQNGRVFTNSNAIDANRLHSAVIEERLLNLTRDYTKTENRAWGFISDNFLQIATLIGLMGMAAGWW